MFGVSRGRIISAIITTVVLTALVVSYIVFALRPGGLHATGAGSTALASATATSGATAQFTPAPGVTVTIHATPTKGTSTSSSSSTTAYTGGAGGTTATVPPRYPTPLPTSGGGFGGGATPTATTPVTPSPTPTGGPTVWRPGPTPTATPVLPDSAELVSYTPTGPITEPSPLLIYATYLNSGPSTWTTAYKFQCRQYCGTPWGNGGVITSSVLPGQSFTFLGSISLTPSAYYHVNTTIWQLWDPTSGYFGPQVSIELINHGWYPALQEASPDCMGDGSVWTQKGSGGTVSCGGSGLMMAQGGTNGVSLDLESLPASYNPGNYLTKIHVHFNTTSASVFAGVIITEPTASAQFREVFMVSPAGYMCYETNSAYCLTGATQPITASSDYDITVSVSSNGSVVSAGSSPGEWLHGGISAGGLTGLIEVASTGVTDAAYFTNYTLYQYK